MSGTRSSYEDIPYDSKPVTPSHPDALATMATLLGMSPAPATQCRVLELGCAGGGNLLPMAETLPGSRFLGIDLSPRQIADGQELVDTLGVANLELKAASIMDVDDGYGKFDYIICHGVYSWVPPMVQDKILEICAHNLNPQGVAYVSYNTYPGWHQRGVLRDVLCYHDQPSAEPHARLGQARAMLKFMAESVAEPDQSYGRSVRETAVWLLDQSDSYIYHEFLEDENNPIYFHQFMARAAEKGLQYLSEPDLDPLDAGRVPDDARDKLRTMVHDLIRLEQYVNFLCRRVFRRTMLCHADVPLDRATSAATLDRGNFLITSPVGPVSTQPNLHPDATEEFRSPKGSVLETAEPVLKGALLELSAKWPAAVDVSGLWQAILQRLAAAGVEPASDGRQRLQIALWQCYRGGMVNLHMNMPHFVLEPGQLPRASTLSQVQAARGRRLVTTLNHKLADLSDVERTILSHLDGQNDRAALLEWLAQHVQRGELTLRENDQPIDDPLRLRQVLEGLLEQSLDRMARYALLVA